LAVARSARASSRGAHQHVEHIQRVVDRHGKQMPDGRQQGRGLAVGGQPAQHRRLAGHPVAGQRRQPPRWHPGDVQLGEAERVDLGDPVQRISQRLA
jgi:hypothetical protein